MGLGRRPSRLRPLNIRRPQPARRLRYVGSQARREPNQDYGRDRAPQPRDVENLFKRRRGIRPARDCSEIGNVFPFSGGAQKSAYRRLLLVRFRLAVARLWGGVLSAIHQIITSELH
jgi:hypothetical protein